MKGRRNTRSLAVVVLAAATVVIAAFPDGAAASGPGWRLYAVGNTAAKPNNLTRFVVEAANAGSGSTTGGYTITAKLPPGLTPIAGTPLLEGSPCAVDVGNRTISCSSSKVLLPYRFEQVGNGNKTTFTAKTSTEPGTRVAHFEVSGGGLAKAEIAKAVQIQSNPVEAGFENFDGMSWDASGAQFTQASGHPEEISNAIDVNTHTDPTQPPPSGQFPASQEAIPVDGIKDVVVDLPPGMIGNPAALSQCTADQLIAGDVLEWRPECPVESQVGTITVKVNEAIGLIKGPFPLYNMVPPVGSPARFGFRVSGVSVTLDAKLRYNGDYGISIYSRNVSPVLPVSGFIANFWGVPGAAVHDRERTCPGERPAFETGESCKGGAAKAFLRLPTRCTPEGQGLKWRAQMDGWLHRGAYNGSGEPLSGDPNWKPAAFETHDPPGYPEAVAGEQGPVKGTDGCQFVPVKGKISVKPTAADTETPIGLRATVEIPNPGLENPGGIAASDIKATRVTLPEGVTINPGQAEGLGTCTEAQYESEELSFQPNPGTGCPAAAKIGTVAVQTPLLDEGLEGDVYVATPYQNPGGTLLGLYLVVKSPQRGVMIKLFGKVETDPETGQITTTFNDLPQLPFSSFELRLRSGSRAPLVTPRACGTYTTEAEFTPWSDPAHQIVSTSSFTIVNGVGGGPCPGDGLPPFKPGLIAGSVNNAAGAYSPFYVRLFRSDEEQEITHFSIKLPPGLVANLKGIPFCSDAAIEAAKARSGTEELILPSCPQASEIGHTLAGAGVGSVLAYAPGKVYLAGPYHGSSLSIVAITAAKVGPFDLGTVVVREALRVNPETAEVFIDPTGSDPLPHIIKGIATHLRDIRAYVDRPHFTINPTSCEPTSTASTLLGAGLDFVSEADDRPVTVATRYQAADCAFLGFKPKLKLSLKGGTKRSQVPALRAVLTARSGDANIDKSEVVLPRSEFLEQGHIRTICTRAQFNAGAGNGAECPAGSIYGRARAVTPILDEALEGPVFLRSNGGERSLPDLVAALRGNEITIDLVGYIDSVKERNRDGEVITRIRNRFETVPDAPVTKFVLEMQGGKKGLLVNSTDICKGKHRVNINLTAQNGKVLRSAPPVRAACGKGKGKKPRR